MELKQQIREIIESKFLEWLRANDENISNVSYPLSEEIDKLVYAACTRQRINCEQAWNEEVGEDSKVKQYNRILNAPLPTSVERYYSGKEMKEIVQKAWNEAGEMPFEDFQSEVLEKEYGIK